jgi:hypothetical protein
MKKHSKIFLTVLVAAAGVAVAGFGVFAAFSSTTSNPGNSFAAGSVTISDNDSGTALYNVSNQKPGVTTTRCIKVTYGGSLDSDVRLYASAVGAGGQYVNLTITSGTGDAADCSDWTIDGSGTPTVYNGTVKAFADARTDWASGLADYKLAQTKWSTNDAVTYRFQTSVQDNNSAQGASTGSHSFTWEARNQ